MHTPLAVVNSDPPCHSQQELLPLWTYETNAAHRALIARVLWTLCCVDCGMRVRCLYDALGNPKDYTIRSGTTPTQREYMRRKLWEGEDIALPQ